MERNLFKNIRTKMDGQGLLILTVIVIMGVLFVFVVETNKPTPGSKIGNGFADVIDDADADEDLDAFIEDVKDEIEEHTD